MAKESESKSGPKKKKPKAEIVPAEAPDLAGSDAFVIMDRWDDEIIAAELMGVTLDNVAYVYEVGGQKALSIAGVNAACNILALTKNEAGERFVVREEEVEVVSETESDIKVVARASSYIVGKDGIEFKLRTEHGAKRQDKRFPKGKRNPHFFEHAVSKARRNAKNALIPAATVTAVFDQAQEQGQVRVLKKKDLVAGGQEDKPKGKPAALPAKGVKRPAPPEKVIGWIQSKAKAFGSTAKASKKDLETMNNGITLVLGDAPETLALVLEAIFGTAKVNKGQAQGMNAYLYEGSKKGKYVIPDYVSEELSAIRKAASGG